MTLSIERLPNGYIQVRDRRSGLVGLYTLDGAHYSGDLRHEHQAVHAWLRTKNYCGICGSEPGNCYNICPNSDAYYSPEQERQDDLTSDPHEELRNVLRQEAYDPYVDEG